MDTCKKYGPQLRAERGVAVLEFMIVLPLIFFFSVAVVDMARWVVRYVETSRVAYEGARYAAGVKDMPEAVAIVDPYGEDFIPSDAHGQVVTRMQRVMTEQDMDPLQVYLRVERLPADAENAVLVEVRVPFEPYSARFLGIGLFQILAQFNRCRAEVKAPYLFPAN